MRKAVGDLWRMSERRSSPLAIASQKIQPPADEGVAAPTDATYAIRHGAQSRSTRLRGDL
jgi:hypothetical protein